MNLERITPSFLYIYKIDPDHTNLDRKKMHWL